MLGCQDFCGYYEWTFHYLRRRFSQAAAQRLWSEAIALDSQRHYIAAGGERGLRGLYETWSLTGEDEKCDWTVDLNEENNVLHVNMHNCPSKGFLIKNNRNADEDYCDHCMGWIAPALAVIDAEVTSHEHNHCGQCWWEFRKKDQPQPDVRNEKDIRSFESWQNGYLDTFFHGIKQPINDGTDDADTVEFLSNYFRAYGPEVLTCSNFLARPLSATGATAIVLDADAECLRAVAGRIGKTCHDQCPLLLYPYFPGTENIPFPAYGLPRPLPVLPLLIRAQVYIHQPDQTGSSGSVIVGLIHQAINKLNDKPLPLPN